MSCLFVLSTAHPTSATRDADAYLAKLAEADRFLAEGNLQMSERIRITAKPAFPGGSEISTPQPITDPESETLAPAAKVYWRNANEGLEQQLLIKTLRPLQLLTDNYPDFLQGHFKLAEVCETYPRECKEQAKEGQPSNALEVLERATNLYPERPDLLDKKLALLERIAERNEEKNAFFLRLLDASMAARQFALSYPEHEAAEKYNQLADAYMKRYQKLLKQTIDIYAKMGIIFGSTKNAMMLQQLAKGENAYGEKMLEDYKKNNTMIQDGEILNYVTRVGQKLATYAGRPDLQFEFVVSTDPTPNAQAFPGGKVVIKSGLLASARTEAELAGIISHEIAHSALSHYYLKQTELGFMGAFSRILPLGSLFRDLTAAEAKARQEIEADVLGTRILAKAGYAADGLWSYLRAMDTALEGKIAWSESHPSPRFRVQALENLIRRNGYSRYAYEGVTQQQACQQQVKKILVGVGAKQAQQTTGDAFVDEVAIAKAQGNRPLDLPEKPVPKSERQPKKISSGQRTRGKIELGKYQERENVKITLTSAYISNSGSYTIDLLIENQSDRSFLVVPVFAQVLDDNGKRVAARYSFETDANQEAIAEPGKSLQGKVVIPSRRWVENDKQGITLMIKEGSVGARVFRIPL
ncbi:MAG: M48 family metalloprotease [Synechococcales bacterium]|nr:M48 family metalloprotease [Synechococcales bacterium]